MKTYDEPKIKEEVICDRCKTKIKDIKLDDLNWDKTWYCPDQPYITCPICKGEVWYVLKEEEK